MKRRSRVAKNLAQQKELRKVLPKREHKAFGAISVYPKRFHFKTQNPGERIYIVARSHIITNLGWISRVILLSVAPVMLMYFFNYFGVGIDIIASVESSLLIMGFYLSLITMIFMNFLSWYYNIYLVTSERIIRYSFRSLGGYRVAETEIENIQDVSQVSVGFLPNIFGFGDIVIQTASTRNKFHFKAVPHPIWFRDVIADLSRLIRTNEP